MVCRFTIPVLFAATTLGGCAAHVEREPFIPSVTRLANSGDVKASLDELANPLIASRRNIGMVVGYATPDEEGIHAFGSKDLEGNVPMTTDAVFQVGSVSKAFVSLLVAELARQGRVNLDDPVGKYLPTGFTTESEDLRRITFLDLASHTSGMKHECYTGELLWGLLTYLVNGQSLYRYMSDDVMRDYLATLDYTLPAKKSYAYSNIGYTYLGWALNQMDPRGLGALLRDHVTGPLGLAHTGLSLSNAPPTDLTPGYAGDLPTFLGRHSPVGPWLFEEKIAGAGAIYSTAEDLLRFAKINAGLTPSPLKESLDVTRRPVADAEGGKIAMSWFIKRLPDSGEAYTYIAGIIGGYTSFVGFDESRGLAVVVLQNSINHDDLIGVELLDRLVAAHRLKHDGVPPKVAPPPKPDGVPLIARRFEAPDYSSK